jgi:hypothetical protein
VRGVVACDTVGRDANVKIGRITKVHVGAVRASGYKFWSFGISHMADITALSTKCGNNVCPTSVCLLLLLCLQQVVRTPMVFLWINFSPSDSVHQARHWPVRSWFLFALFCSVSVRGSFSKKTDQRQNLSNPELLVIFFMFV